MAEGKMIFSQGKGCANLDPWPESLPPIINETLKSEKDNLDSRKREPMKTLQDSGATSMNHPKSPAEGGEEQSGAEGVEGWNPRSRKPIIAVREVTKVYKNILGLNNVTLNIYPGITGLLGPNGAGKSTLLKLMVNIVKPSQGSIFIKDRSVVSDPYLFERIGYVSEYDSFYPEMTGFQYVVFFLKINGIKQEEAETRARLILERLEMQESMNRRIDTYSKGMKQKVKIARALAFDPEIILLDEPLNGTDPETRSLLIENIRHWGKIGKTVIVSSHILHEIERVTSNIILINKGRIYAVGDISRLRTMMDEHPHKIEIELFQEEDVRPLAASLLKLASVDSTAVRVEKEKKVYLTSSRPGDFFLDFPKVCSEQNIKVKSMHSIDDNLQSLYYYLMAKRGW